MVLTSQPAPLPRAAPKAAFAALERPRRNKVPHAALQRHQAANCWEKGSQMCLKWKTMAGCALGSLAGLLPAHLLGD